MVKTELHYDMKLLELPKMSRKKPATRTRTKPNESKPSIRTAKKPGPITKTDIVIGTVSRTKGGAQMRLRGGSPPLQRPTRTELQD